jgi:hypothetical protein
MKKTIGVVLIGIAFTASSAAHANCFGSSAMETCTDANGNSYSINRMGSMTTVNGYNAQTGSSWRETANTYGNTTTINGTAANGQSWNETIQNFGNGNRSMSGMDSDGNFFSRTCTPYGCN